MLDFLKRFGLGVLYVLISPFVIAFLCLWALFNLSIFFIEFFKSLSSFFKGKKFFVEFPEDIEAKRILTLEPYNNENNNQTINNQNNIQNNTANNNPGNSPS